MANQTETIATRLGALRKGLVDQGFEDAQAYQIVLDLIRRGSEPVRIAEGPDVSV